MSLPSTPILTEAIPPQSFEVVRDRIAQILALELPGQAALQPDEEALQNITVWTDRNIPFDEAELPAINVLFSTSTYDADSRAQVSAPSVYVVDVYTSAKHVLDGATVEEYGDVKSAYENNRILGVIRAILQAAPYKTLAFTPAEFCMSGRTVNSITGVDPGSLGMDVENVSKGQLRLTVRLTETQEFDKARALAQLVTKGRIDGGDRGIVWNMKEETP